jgi:hypothetical protein
MARFRRVAIILTIAIAYAQTLEAQTVSASFRPTV